MEIQKKRRVDLTQLRTSPELAEVKVSYKTKRKGFVKIMSSKDAFDVLYSLFDNETIEYQEEFFLLLLNRANHVLGWIKLSLGGTTGTVVDPKIIFALALQTNACSLILSHNHPSGNTKPSDADVRLTRQVKDAGKLLDIAVLDHIIITPDNSFYMHWYRKNYFDLNLQEDPR